MNSIESEYFTIKRLMILYFFFTFLIWFFLTKDIKPDLTITPNPPSKEFFKLASIGDDSFVYRYFGYVVQIAGDDYGTTTPLKNYNYSKLQKWFYQLSEFDSISEYVPSIAGFYYSNSQNAMDNVYIVDYLVHFADTNPNKNWRWYSTAIYLAHVKLKDQERVKEIAQKLIKLDPSSVPLWARAIGIFMATKKDVCDSLDLISLFDEYSFESMTKDKVFGNKGDEGNIFLGLIIERIDEIRKDPVAVQKCISKKQKQVINKKNTLH